jgi:hypothetical protein
MVFELLVQESYQWRVKCAVEVNFSDMCWTIDGKCKLRCQNSFEEFENRSILFLGNKPSFGPAHIYFYEGVHKHLFYGKLLISIETEEIDEKFVSTLQQKQDILMPLNETDYWNDEIFKVNLILVNLDALNLQQSRMKLYLSCENNFSNTIELETKEYEGKMKMKFVQFNSNVRPLLSMSVKLPDNRLKHQMKNLIRMLVHEMVRIM